MKEAIKFRNSKIGDIAKGIIPPPRMDKTSFEDLAGLIATDYQNRRHKSVETLGYHLEHLKKFFGGYRAVNITSERIQGYIDKRREEGVQDPTIHRELSTLRRMFTLAAELTPPKVSSIPTFPKLDENLPGKGSIPKKSSKPYGEHFRLISNLWLPLHIAGGCGKGKF